MATMSPLKKEAAAVPFRKNLAAHVICSECKEVPPNLEFDSHQTTCGSCGLVLGDRGIDMGSEWRTFSNDDQNSDDPSRVGDANNPLLNGDQLETTIASGATGRSRDLYRAQNKQSNDKQNKALMQAYKEIGAMCEGFNIQKNVADTAKYLFKTVDDAKAFKGKSQDVLIAGCIFIACRKCKVPRSFSEIFAVTKVSRKEIGRIYKSLEKFFTQNDEARKAAVVASGGTPDNAVYETTTSTKPSDMCNRFCNLLRLEYPLPRISVQLSDRVTASGILAGRSPLSIVAACIYMASHLMGQGKSPKEISQIVHVSDGTIRGAYKHLYAARERLIDPSWIEKDKGDMSKLPAA